MTNKEAMEMREKTAREISENNGMPRPMKVTTLKQAKEEIDRLRNIMWNVGLYTPQRKLLLEVSQRLYDQEKAAHQATQQRLFKFEHAVRDVHRSILRRAQLSHESSEALRAECPDLSIADGISKYNGIRSAALIKKALDTLKDEQPQQACCEEQEAQAQA